MFKGFNMHVTDHEKEILIANYYEYGKSLYNNTKNEISTKLDSYIGVNGYMDCSRLQEDWFPTLLDNHIFLSHSHQDEQLAISISGWLHKKFGLKTFIDSCVWGYSDKLLHEIDNKYSKIPNRELYEYQSVKKTTSYIHMMLSTALNKMIDSTECVIFLNTDNSILQAENIISTQTQSAWIYSEINTTSFIKEKRPTRYSGKLYHSDIMLIENYQEAFKPTFDLDLRHLISLCYSDFNNMKSVNRQINPEIILDNLYLAKKIIRKK